MPNTDAAKGRPCKALQGRRDRDAEQLSRERGAQKCHLKLSKKTETLVKRNQPPCPTNKYTVSTSLERTSEFR